MNIYLYVCMCLCVCAFFLMVQVTDNAVFSRDSQCYLFYQPVPSQ